jgi:DNA-binding MarR family transcriptional regulator
VSYNVKKLVEAGYLHHARSSLDRRAVRISLTPRGRRSTASCRRSMSGMPAPSRRSVVSRPPTSSR